jgi:hypothetical protein
LIGDNTLPYREIIAERAVDCSLDGEITQRSVQGTSLIASGSTRNVVSTIPQIAVADALNLLTNPRGYNATEGVVGAGGAVPTAWRPSGANNGLSMQILRDQILNDSRLIGYRIFGITTGTSTGIICPEVRTNIAFDALNPRYSFDCGIFVEGGAFPLGSQLTMSMIGWQTGGTAIAESSDLAILGLSGVNSTLRRFSVSRTMTNPLTAHPSGQIAYSIPSGQTVDLTIWVHAPALSKRPS